MNAYQNEQRNALTKALSYLETLSSTELKMLQNDIQPYIQFREEVEIFLSSYCSDACTLNCYTSKTSACCSKDGIIIFWADVLINAVCSTQEQLGMLMASIRFPKIDYKCIYLGATGCCWQVRPLVCAMFLCNFVQQGSIDKNENACDRWAVLNSRAKSFRWPDRPVLFDQLEQRCMSIGIHSSLMYLNNSPGLLAIKRKAGLR